MKLFIAVLVLLVSAWMSMPATGAVSGGPIAARLDASGVDRHRPGHIAVVRPGTPDAARLAAEGPDVTQAGAANSLAMPLRQAFRHHPGAWPNQIGFFAHAIG